ncbi:MAG TPA: phytoene/squalene synthase family protein [Pseudoxanthomonas sp.]|nr:phytoene/squalene synthase family protein [Pseudoxanthomonas sp.]
MSDSTALRSFLDKWRQRWPEWSVVEVFVPPPQRRTALAWFALLQEFEDTMNIAGDPLPADAKLGWWTEELRDWSNRCSRHPLGRVLEPHVAPWAELAAALPALQRARPRPLDQDTAFATLSPLAVAIGQVEASLFETATDAAGEVAIGCRLLASRLQQAGAAGVPMRVNGEIEPDAVAWARELRRRWPMHPRGGTPRRVWSALARLRLQRSGAGEAAPPLSPARALWVGWRAARR